MHCFIISSQILTGLVCMVPPLSILLSPASMLLFKMSWNMQFPVASQTLIRNSHIGILVP
jgi:hypothetical protein